MKQILNLMKRNTLIFFRDYSAVFFSILSMLIVLALMVVFLGSMNSDSVVNVLAQYGEERNTKADQTNAKHLVQMWTLAGILVVNSVTVTLTALGSMVSDETKGRLASFYVSPVKRIKIALGYILSAWFIGTIMCFLTLIIGEAYMALQGHTLLPLLVWIKLIGMICLNTFVYASLGYLLALFIHSDSAWSGMLTIVGTLVGFLGGIYLPMSMLPEGVSTVLKCLPILHGASMMRKVLIEDALSQTFEGLPEMVPAIFKEMMGVTIKSGETEITLTYQILFLLSYAIIAIIVASLISNKRKVSDR